ncbi:isochorismatase family protein [Veronia nyctiphanis]|uniref:isochorismatase family protein n=1 Tax=Veronia nyctiphanis TaxID=1278244 RepID=UPI00191BF922|nr:isochorismatase family protein [Veronia nyctiphanis]
MAPSSSFLTSTAGEHHTLTKTNFSLVAEPGAIADLAGMEKRQVIIIGIEAHVCVLQSAIGLLENGFEVYLGSDAIGSRSSSHVDDAIRRAEVNDWVLCEGMRCYVLI